jgi:GntR family transcriptional regulator
MPKRKCREGLAAGKLFRHSNMLMFGLQTCCCRRKSLVAIQADDVTRTQAIAAELTDEIVKGQYIVGARFPTEPELRARFGVGRHTIPEALKLLTEQGLIGRRRKTGTFPLATSPVSPYVHSLRDLKGLLDFAETTRLQVAHVDGVSSDSKLLTGFENFAKGRWLRVAGTRVVRGDDVPLC